MLKQMGILHVYMLSIRVNKFKLQKNQSDEVVEGDLNQILSIKKFGFSQKNLIASLQYGL